MQLFADLLFSRGPVYTADPARPWAGAVAVRDGVILAVGDGDELDELQGPATETVDLDGHLLLPGFTESHVHMVELALRRDTVDVTPARSAEEAAARVRAFALGRPGDGWVRGGGWDANSWPADSRPHRAQLDAAAGDLPVALDSKELHAVWANSAALRRAGITSSMPEVAGGVIERDENGEPTGILRENAVALLAQAYPAADPAGVAEAMRRALPDLWSTGIVAIHQANDTPDGLALQSYQELRRRSALGLRVLQHIPVCNLAHASGLGMRTGFGDRWLRIGGVKMFADGALGSRTASMLQPYRSEPANWGISTMDPEEMLEQALSASAAGLSLTIHAIGDRANRDVLDVLAEVRRTERETGRPALRHRIEHVQCIHPDDLPRLAALEVAGSVQPVHATSDMVIADRYWGAARARGAYAFRSLLDSGARLVFGSDGPIEPHAPLTGIHAAVTRRRADGSPGSGGWQSQERIGVAEAVDAYTRWPAWVAAEESYRGSITLGKAADLVLLGGNIFTLPPMEILATPVALTVLDGRVVWRA